MFEAQYLFSADVVYGPWVSREGDEIVVTGDLVAANVSRLSFRLFTKNEEDAGDGEALSGYLTLTNLGRGQKKWTGLKELVRIEATCEQATDGYVLGRVLDPVWFDAVSAVEN